MLDEGLYLHPRHVGCLVALAKMEKVDEQFESAMLLLRQAQQVGPVASLVVRRQGG